MKKAACICLSGPEADEIGRSLAVDLIKRHQSAELIDMKAIKRFGTAKIAADVCGLLARNGTFVVLTHPKVHPVHDKIVCQVKSNTTPADTIDAIIEKLIGLGYLSKEAPKAASEEDEFVHDQLVTRNLLG